MTYFDFNIGDRVHYFGDFDAEGVVVDKTSKALSASVYCIGVDFSSNLSGWPRHRLRDSISSPTMEDIELPDPTGWWCQPNYLEIIERPKESVSVTSVTVLNFLGC